METVEHGMDTRKQPPPLNAERAARMFDCQDECRDMRTRMMEEVAVLLVVLSVILSVFIGHGDESNLGGKTAAIQFYYNSLELARNTHCEANIIYKPNHTSIILRKDWSSSIFRVSRYTADFFINKTELSE